MVKLGEALVKKGLITEENLRLALERQVVFGGRIGTNIVELGILKEDEFTKFLSSYLKVPRAEPSEFLNIEPDTLSCLGKDLVEKYRAVPFRKEKKRLHVAMIEPKNIHSLDDMRFICGYDIIPYVASELRILYALEKYYGLKRDLRFISILDKEEETVKYTDSDEALKKVKGFFTVVTGRDQVAGIVLSESQKVAKRAVLFMVRGNSITGWQSKGIDVSGFDSEAVAPSLFHDVLMRRSYYRGPVLKIKGNAPLIELLGGNPRDSLLVPINIRDRVIAMLYADNGNSKVLDANLTYIHTLCQLASLSFELLVVKKKIMEL